jgi:hypothetical protein
MGKTKILIVLIVLATLNLPFVISMWEHLTAELPKSFTPKEKLIEEKIETVKGFTLLWLFLNLVIVTKVLCDEDL